VRDYIIIVLGVFLLTKFHDSQPSTLDRKRKGKRRRSGNPGSPGYTLPPDEPTLAVTSSPSAPPVVSQSPFGSGSAAPLNGDRTNYVDVPFDPSYSELLPSSSEDPEPQPPDVQAEEQS